MSVLRETRRYWRSNRLSAVLVSAMLAFGFSGSALTLAVMLALSSPRSGGLRPLHYMTLAEETLGGNSRPLSWATYEHVRDSITSRGPTMVAYAEPTRARMQHQTTTVDISVAGISEGFFSQAVEGLVGQDFSPSWEGDSGVGEIILSASLQEKFFSSPAYALGQNITVNGQSYRIVGIAPKALTGLWYPTDAWIPPDRIFSLTFGISKEQTAPPTAGSAAKSPKLWRTSPVFYALAFSRQLTEKGMLQLLSSVIRSQDNSPYHLHVTDGLSNDPVRDQKVRSWSHLSFVLSLALIFVAGFNYCGLLVAQVPRRVAELRLKRALGATVIRIITENCYGPASTVIAGFIIACGITVAGAWIFKTQASSYMELRITWATLAEVLGLELFLAAVLAAVVALIPTSRLLSDNGGPRLGYTSTSGKRAVFMLQGIVAVQIAFCILIGFATTMIFGAVRSMSHSALGFSGDELMVVPVGLSPQGGNVDFRTSSTQDFPMEIFTREVVQRTSETLPAMRSIAASSCAPFGQPMKMIKISAMSHMSSSSHTVRFCGATQGFFETMGNPIVEGRGFSSSSLVGTISEVVINRNLAEELWSKQSPLHQVVQLEQPDMGMRFAAEVVGVTQDMRLSGRVSTPEATVFLPLKSEVFGLSLPLYFLVKGPVAPHTLEILANQQASLYMPALVANAPYQINEKLRSSSFEQTMRIYFATGGAALIALIAFTGLYGVLVYFTNARRKEIALRMCFGASKWDVRKSVIRPAIQCALVAILLSLLGWRGLAQLGASEWMGEAAWSWVMVLIIPVGSVMASILISLIPANAAARVSPGEILKEQ